MILVRSHTPQPFCGQELQCSLVVVVVADGWTLESQPRGLLFLKSSLHNMANAPLDPPPEGVCVTAFYWLGLFDAWLRWHVIGRREGWVEELTLHSPPSSLPTPSKQAHGPVACSSKRWASHDRSSTLGSSAAAAAAKVPRALSSASIAMDPSSLDACLNWWRRWAGPLPPTMSRQTPLSPCPC